MKRESIISSKAPEAVGPYSHGYRAGTLFFVSGQMPVDPADGKFVEGDAGKKAARCMENVLVILGEVGLTAKHIVKTTIFVTDLDNFGLVNEAYASFFEGDYPARSCVEVPRLPKDVEVEIEVVACFD